VLPTARGHSINTWEKQAKAKLQTAQPTTLKIWMSTMPHLSAPPYQSASLVAMLLREQLPTAIHTQMRVKRISVLWHRNLKTTNIAF